jgi:hypothetical protein
VVVTDYLLWLFNVLLMEAIVLISFAPAITVKGGDVGGW